MKALVIITLFCIPFGMNLLQAQEVDPVQIQEDLEEILQDIEYNYVYLEEKEIDLNCIREHYQSKIANLKTYGDVVLFFEFLLDEFYDNHLTLRTNTQYSYRLFAPIYVQEQNGQFVITQVWQTQLTNLNQDIIGAQIITINGKNFYDAINDFPTHCQDKNNPEIKEWIANKVLSGRYNEPRILQLKLRNGVRISFDVDALQFKENNTLLSVKKEGNIGVIQINNSLGNAAIVKAFDEALDTIMDTDGLILDLRNTVFGGNSYEARGIMSRFITAPQPYQRHTFMETSQNNPDVERNWVEYVTPRLQAYKKPVMVLVGRWTGSMGEGLAIGFEGMNRGEVVGTEMRRLAGEVFDFGFPNTPFGFKLSTRKLFHLNGTPREEYLPTNYVKQTTTTTDETLLKAIELIKKKN